MYQHRRFEFVQCSPTTGPGEHMIGAPLHPFVWVEVSMLLRWAKHAGSNLRQGPLPCVNLVICCCQRVPFWTASRQITCWLPCTQRNAGNPLRTTPGFSGHSRCIVQSLVLEMAQRKGVQYKKCARAQSTCLCCSARSAEKDTQGVNAKCGRVITAPGGLYIWLAVCSHGTTCSVLPGKARHPWTLRLA